jgi:hypothetical protein
VVWQGERYHWTKDREFLAVKELPTRTSARLELAVDDLRPEADDLRALGWSLVPRGGQAGDQAGHGLRRRLVERREAQCSGNSAP